ncbi:DNA internalization-related competence protein ComEC/Rec2 [Cytobacillus purgationiresistens]|uniref:Competence protein ComEC n=1 Tax=Cytobacillus purgationiresistens TaxID=863449 RepID=A0ABU0AE45_9BACI|nr:DNA internalization-related competence protein ComEC/Rec2 [Cytobacillus purgationiresistens]MDQ0269521.1 competence protein ComEC [Cytobacillus purgationiresistens]
MKGKWTYIAFAALLGILSAFISPIFFVIIVFLHFFLIKIKQFKKNQIILLLLVFAGFFLRTEWAEKQNISQFAGAETNFHILFHREWQLNGDFLSAEIKELHSKEKMMLRYKVKTKEEKEGLMDHLHAGFSCSVSGVLTRPSAAVNPNGFDYMNYLAHKQIYWLLEINELDTQRCSSQNPSFSTFFQNLRNKGISYIQNQFPTDTAPLAAALLFGDRGLIDEQTIGAYRRLGVIHLLAISGLHVGMLTGMIFYMGIRLGVTKESMTNFLLFFLPCYAILAGAAPSVLRAVCMLMIALLARKYLSSLLTQDVISLVMIAYTFAAPYIIFHVGFQLSFVVTFLLILSAPVLIKRITHPLGLLLATSLVCQLAATPILLYYFFEVSVVSIIANAIYVPLFSVVILPVLLFLFVVHLLVGEVLTIPLIVTNLLFKWLDKFSGSFAEIPFAVLTLGRPHPLLILCYLIVIPVFFLIWEKKSGFRFFMRSLLLPVMVLFIHFLSTTYSPYGEVTFIDVGQGDSIFIKLPYGQGNYLIDTGGVLMFETEEWQRRKKGYDPGKEVVLPFLKSRGVRVIDKLILTHGDADHIGGAKAILSEVNIKEIVMPVTKEVSDLEKALLTAASEKKVPVRFIQSGENWASSDASFFVLSPEERIANKNDGSLVIYGEMGGLTWLFTGDLEEEGERRLIEVYPSLTVDILKVGHHGSKSSSTNEFLTSVNPSIAIITAGRNNRYGHPHAEVVDRLGEKGVRVLRTDLHGAITYKFSRDGGTFFVVLP